MEKTKCLYDEFPYETEFDANVLAVKALNEAQDRYEVILDQTLFFPEQGGQTPDQGWLSVGHGLVVEPKHTKLFVVSLEPAYL